MSVWYCEELDVLTIRHKPAFDLEMGLMVNPVEWSPIDFVRARELRSRYNGVADLSDLFTWEKIGDFD